MRRNAVRVGGLSGNIDVPQLPALVWSNMFTTAYSSVQEEAHHPGTGIAAACGTGLSRFALIDTQRIRAHESVLWCTNCWPGGRCVVCGAPSGGHDECRLHLSASIEVDKQFVRAEQ